MTRHSIWGSENGVETRRSCSDVIGGGMEDLGSSRSYEFAGFWISVGFRRMQKRSMYHNVIMFYQSHVWFMRHSLKKMVFIASIQSDSLPGEYFGNKAIINECCILLPLLQWWSFQLLFLNILLFYCKCFCSFVG